ncbi:MAG: tetratricopeptide repeat protein [Planctomycetota bacterium]
MTIPDFHPRLWVPWFLILLAGCGSGSGPEAPERPPASTAPTLDPALEAEAEALLRAGDLPGIATLLEPHPPESLTSRAALLLAIALHKGVRYGAAEPLFAQALAAQPPVEGRAGGLHFHAWCLLQLGRLDEARARFEEHAVLDPEEGDTSLGLGRIALAEGRLEHARLHLRRAVDLHRGVTASGRADRREEEGRCLAWLSDVELESGNLPDARAALEASVRAFPFSRGAWTKLHDVCLAMGDETAANSALERRGQLDAALERASLEQR